MGVTMQPASPRPCIRQRHAPRPTGIRRTSKGTAGAFRRSRTGGALRSSASFEMQGERAPFSRECWHLAGRVDGMVRAIWARGTRVSQNQLARTEEQRMDLLYIGLTVGFFALSWAFVVACDRLS